MSIIESDKNMLTPKHTILFVGSFKQMTKDGSVGGQMFACNSIMKSVLSAKFNWILIDTTSISNIKSIFLIRLILAIRRIIVFIFYSIFCKIDKYLIFVGDGWSFWEKGLMLLIAKYFTKADVILAPRSGFIERDIRENKFLKRFIRHVLIKADKVVCQSKKWQLEFDKLINSTDEKFVIIENGINLMPYISFPILNKKSPVDILYLSWVDRNKGIYDLLEAVLMLKKDGLNFRLNIAGKGSGYDDARKFILSNNLAEQVFFFGWAYDEDKFNLFKHSHIFVLPTHFDGYPNSLLEAMVSGKACIATSVGSIPDMIEDYKTGLLVQKESPTELYRALKLMISDADFRISISHEARNTVIKRNSLDVFVLKFSDLLTNR